MTEARAAVVFDLYGTLVDVRTDEESPSVWANISAQFFGQHTNVSGKALHETYVDLCETLGREREEGFLLDSVFAQLLTRYGVSPSHDAVKSFGRAFRQSTLVYLRKKQYTDRLLDDIRASSYKLGLISNTEALLTRYDLEVLELEHRFDQIVLSSGIGIKKPDSRIFSEMLARLDVAPRTAAAVGDDFDADVVGALHAGMDAIYLTAGAEHVRPVSGSGKIICSTFSLIDIREALRTLGFVLVTPDG
jgi:putative hydrolase of the HAD superfamily